MNPNFSLSEDDIKVTLENALDLFYSGIKSKETKRTMDGNLKYFLEIICKNILQGDYKQRAQQFVGIVKEDQQKASGIVIAYVKELEKRTRLDKTNSYYIRPSYVPNKIKPIHKLLTMNGLGLPWKKIHAFYPELNGVYKGRGYTRKEIQKMLEYSNSIQTDFIILAQSSGGLRIGAWENQKWGNIFPIYKTNDQFKIELEKDETGEIVCAAMIIHQGTNYEYTALISIEAWEKLQEYKKYWIKKYQMSPTENDSLLISRSSGFTPLNVSSIRARIGKVVERAGLRTPLTEGNRRHDVPATHGFRRYWDKIMMNIKMKKGTLAALTTKEYLMGHKGLVKTDKNYFWADIQDQVPDYLEAMTELMIGEEYRLTQKLESEKNRADNLEEKSKQLELALLRLAELEAKMSRIEKYPQKI